MKLPQNAIDIRSVKHLFLASLSIWAFTSISYWVLSLFISLLESHSSLIAYSSVLTFLLAIAVIAFISNIQFSSNLKPMFGLFGHAMLLFFTVHGIQAFYAAVQSPNQVSNVEAQLLPFFDARPWLPPAGMNTDLAMNKLKVVRLSSENADLINSLDSAVTRLESCGLMTDSIFLTAIPMSREVSKGGMFRSDIVLAARLDKSYVKRITVNNSEIQLKNGVGVFEENTSNYSNVRNLYYRAEIELYGETKEITTSDSYRIVRPFIEVSSQAVNSLYLNCGNQLNIQAPILGTDYKPTFKVAGGSFKYGNEPGKITVLPTSREVNIDVYNQNSMIGKKIFPVRRVPAPLIRPLADGRPVDLVQGISKGTTSISLSVHADEDFKRLLPKDANYKVQDCLISLVSNGTIRSKMKGKANTNISSLVRRAKAGDQLKIEINTVLRKNFKGDIERVVSFYPKFFLIELK